MSYKTNLNTEKEKKILNNLGIDTSTLKTNLESELLDAIVEATEGGAGGGSSGGGSDINIINADSLFAMGKNYDQLSSIIGKIKPQTATYMFSNAFNGTVGQYNDTSNVTELDLTNFDTSQLKQMNAMFYNCKNLRTIIGDLDASNVETIQDLYYACSSLEEIGSLINLGKGFKTSTYNDTSCCLNLSICTKLTHDSLMNIINGLYDLNLTYDVANGGILYKQQLQLGSTNLAKLTDEEKAIVINKNWILS